MPNFVRKYCPQNYFCLFPQELNSPNFPFQIITFFNKIFFFSGLNEAIKLEAHHSILQDISQLENLVPKKSPRYSLLRFKNENLAKGEAICIFLIFLLKFNFIFQVFIYSIPPSQSCTIKELMLFSSCKGPLIGEIESKSIGIVIDKKVFL